MNKPKTGSRKKTQVRTATGRLSAKLTKKQKKFADLLIENKDDMNYRPTDAILDSYNVTDKKLGAVMANENLKNPNIILYTEQHIDRATKNIVDIANDSDLNPSVRLKANQDILDRTQGKASQSTTVESKVLNINIDFTQAD